MKKIILIIGFVGVITDEEFYFKKGK